MTRCNWNGSVASVWERKPRNAGTENCRKKAPPRTEVPAKHVKISSSIHSKLPGYVLLLAAAVQPVLISVEIVGFDDAVAQPVAVPIFGTYLPG